MVGEGSLSFIGAMQTHSAKFFLTNSQPPTSPSLTLDTSLLLRQIVGIN